jgi:hypothetical protein
MPWIHVTDLCRLYLHVIESGAVQGPVNAVAPGAVRSAEFTKAVARALHRPAFLPVPAFALKMLPGGMGDVFLHSQRVVSSVALESGFSFLYPDLTAAVCDVFGHAES